MTERKFSWNTETIKASPQPTEFECYGLLIVFFSAVIVGLGRTFF